jgi:putative addiction module component (TIGR02574 family)
MATPEADSRSPRRRALDEQIAAEPPLSPLDLPPDAEGKALTDAWREEVARRSAEFDAGQAETVTWQEVQARWRSRRAAGG